ncbi:MAG: 3'-5' exonuclease domain-containing protein 2 [Paludibacteraceae bacterium]|nr:3'-5' exonuclease domain-containing protein 2 [Paludibacteraceae bacterium]
MQTYRETILKDEIEALPPLVYTDRKIVVIETVRDAVNACKVLAEGGEVLGFDTETKPSFKKGVSHKIALMQISKGDVCYLFRLCKIEFPQCLVELLGNGNVTKVGLSLRDDFQQIRRRRQCELKGFIDIQKLVPAVGIKELSLRKIYAIMFGKKISKAQQLTNWEADSLDEKQQMYAAIDAWACVEIYEKLTVDS